MVSVQSLDQKCYARTCLTLVRSPTPTCPSLQFPRMFSQPRVLDFALLAGTYGQRTF